MNWKDREAMVFSNLVFSIEFYSFNMKVYFFDYYKIVLSDFPYCHYSLNSVLLRSNRCAFVFIGAFHFLLCGSLTGSFFLSHDGHLG